MASDIASLPYMPFYPADYMADAHHLTTLEHGAYFLLIMSYWTRREPLPNDDRKLARMARMDPRAWKKISEDVMEFFELRGENYHHNRIDAELEKANSKILQAREAGRASARKRSMNSANEGQRTFDGMGADDERPPNDPDPESEPESLEEGLSKILASWSAMVSTVNAERGKTLLSDVSKMTDKRKKALRARIKENGIEDIINAIEQIPRRPYLMGLNDREWTANFDWLLRPNSVTNILEGNMYTRTGDKRSGWN